MSREYEQLADHYAQIGKLPASLLLNCLRGYEQYTESLVYSMNRQQDQINTQQKQIAFLQQAVRQLSAHLNIAIEIKDEL